MATTLQKVHLLIELAARDDTPIDEARAAAFTAVRLIKKHGFKISDGSVGSTTPRAFFKGGLGVDFEEMFKQAIANSESAKAKTRRRWPDAGKTPRAKPRDSGRPFPGPETKSPETETYDSSHVVLVAQHAGICSVCNDVYGKGERIIWMPNDKVICHLNCYAKACEPGRTEQR